jgi:sugar transferase (PEP-CTERM/EpsH1 system associated)
LRDLLFLSQRIPYPPNKGDKIRSFNILKHLSATHRIHLACFIDDEADWAETPALDEYCVQTHFVRLNPTTAKLRSLKAFATGDALNLPYFYDGALDSWIQQTIQTVKPPLAFVFSSQMVQYLFRADHEFEKIVVDFCDVDSDKWRQYSDVKSWPMNWVYRRESEKLLEYDRKVAGKVDAATFVATPEVELFNKLSPETTDNISAVSNGIDCDYFDPHTDYTNPYEPGPHGEEGPVLIFTGAMDYWPNIQCVQWFASEIFPLILPKIPNASFHIVGGNPSPQVKELSENPSIYVSGRVPDMRPYFKHAKIAVVPIQIARGMQNKVLEAMAMALPTVVTPQALEGINLPDAPSLYLADTAQTFADSCVDALLDKTSAVRGEISRQWVMDKYSWNAQLGAYDELLA